MNTSRISGLASGIDTEQIIRDLMKAERIPMDKLFQKKTVLEWQRDQYREMNTKLLALRDATFDMKLSSTFSSRNVSSSNSEFVSATANSTASLSSFTISSIEQLATAAQRLSTTSIEKDGTTLELDQSLWSQRNSLDGMTSGHWKAGSVEFASQVTDEAGKTFSFLKGDIKVVDGVAEATVEANGKSYTVVTDKAAEDLTTNEVLLDAETGELTFGETIEASSQISVNYVVNERTDSFTAAEGSYEFQLTKKSIAGEADANGVLSSVTVTVDGQEYTVYTDPADLTNSGNEVVLNQATGELTFLDSDENVKKDAKIEVTYQQNYTSVGFGVHDEKGNEQKTTLFIQGSDSFTTMMNQMNRSDTGVQAFYDEFTGRFSLSRSVAGDYNKTGDELSLYGGFLTDVLKLGVETGGVNAKFTINGIETERTSNQFLMNGVEFQLKGTFTETDPAVRLTVSNNTEDVFTRIKEYVEKYNEVVDALNGKLTEKRHRDFQPLTDEQKEGMSERQIELWEEKSQSGLLRSDPIFSGALSAMRMDLYGKVSSMNIDSAYDHLSEIGITTSADYLSGGKLIINEAELKEALQTDPESVKELFLADGETDSQRGIAQRLYDTLDGYMSRITEKAGKSTQTNDQFSLGKQLDDMEDRMIRFEDRLQMVENRYYRQFTAMEMAIQRANQQSAYLMSQFSGA
ncbi:flagellar filament capping protein FliD [Aureibacillus halotolerans]|nr:flagellar filament capping protein FliD [Aureibacillus halotolerans]